MGQIEVQLQWHTRNHVLQRSLDHIRFGHHLDIHLTGLNLKQSFQIHRCQFRGVA